MTLIMSILTVNSLFPFNINFEIVPAGQILTNNYRTQYSDLIYSDQALVRTALTQKYPGAFDDYFSLLREISYGNICQIYFSKDPVELAGKF